jgi:hypothetical protein
MAGRELTEGKRPYAAFPGLYLCGRPEHSRASRAAHAGSGIASCGLAALATLSPAAFPFLELGRDLSPVFGLDPLAVLLDRLAGGDGGESIAWIHGLERRLLELPLEAMPR